MIISTHDVREDQYVVYSYGATQFYNNEKIVYAGNQDWMVPAREIWPSNIAGELLEIHAMTVKYDKYCKFNQVVKNPSYDSKGTAILGRVKTESGFGDWVFACCYEPASLCAQVCASTCAGRLVNNVDFRMALTESFRTPKRTK